MVSDEFKHFKAARICFAWAGLWIYGKVLMWGIATSEKFAFRAFVVATVCAIVGLGFVELMRVVTKREKTASEHPQQVQVAPEATVEPIIEPSYDLNMFGLPIRWKAYSQLSIVVIRQSRKVEMVNMVNNGAKDLIWPTQWPTKSPFPSVSVGIIRLSNHGSVGAYNLAYSVAFSIGTQKGPGGIERASITLPLVNVPVNGQSPEFYIVNQSEYPAMIELSRTAVVSVQGEKTRRTIALQVRDLTFFDKIPLLMESPRKWKGDQIVDPDTGKKSGSTG